MSPRPLVPSLVLFLILFVAATAPQAMTIDFGGASDPSLHGATGSLSIDGPFAAGSGTFDVIWSMSFEGYQGAVGDHQYLTNIAFKAFHDISAVELVGIDWRTAVGGAALYPANVNNGGCVGGSQAGMVCVELDPRVDATLGGTLTARFSVTGRIDMDEWSYRGKFGPENGWVISESSAPVPEPGAALIFGAGIAIVGLRLRHR